MSLDHVGIIVDGNRRWAGERGLPKLEGHRQGYKNVRALASAIFERGVPYASFYLFSRENWNRAPEEVDYLMRLFEEILTAELDSFVQEGIKLLFIGNRTELSERLRILMGETEEKTRMGTKGNFLACINYGGQQDIVEAVRALAQQKEDLKNLNCEQLQRALSTHLAPPVDLIIRTSGEQRLSNFMVWESAYAELYFSPKFFPDFNERDLDEALGWYKLRQRRFGV